MRKYDLPRYLFVGALSGGIIGTADAVVAAVGSNPGLPPTSLLASLLFAGAVLLPFGILLGSALFAVSPIWPNTATIVHATMRLRRPRNAMLFVFFFVCGITALLTAGYKRGIMVDAINFRPFLLVGGFLTLFWIGGRLFHSSPRRGAAGTAAALLSSVLVLSFLGSRIGGIENVLTVLTLNTSLVKYTVSAVKSGFDKDNDGFATLLCGADCDCDDSNPNRNPAAVDIPDNNIDEDCNGKDLSMAALGGTASRRSGTRAGNTAVAAVQKGAPYNLLLITIDALRADRMHMYGHHRETTPNLDRFATKSVRFEHVRSQGPSTRHVFPVLLTGRYFSTIALKKGKKWSKLLASNRTFAEYLKEKKYKTIAMLPYFRFKEQSGFQQGFDVWETVLDSDRDATWDPTGDLVTNRGIAHLETLKKHNGPWLLWLHYFDPHASYVKHDDQPGYGNEKADRYDGEIRYVDRQIQRFLDAFAESGLDRHTATVITSDHGEGIGLKTDHGFNYHGFSLFDSETRIPLIMRIPGIPPGIVSECVGIIDVPPTILALAGIDVPKRFHGVSLIPFLTENPPQRGPFLIQLPETTPQEAIVDWPYKLIWHVKTNHYGLYNLERDPNEQENLAQKETATAEKLKQALKLKLYQLSAEQFGAVEE